MWRDLLALCDALPRSRRREVADVRQFAAEALAIHLEHRRRDFHAAREHALFVLEECGERRADGVRHRLARLERKILKTQNAQLFSS